MTVPETRPQALAELTTLRLGGPAAELVEAHDEAELDRGGPLRRRAAAPRSSWSGGGSNLVVADEGFDGRVVVVRNTGLRSEGDTCGGAFVEVGAGENWDDVVATAVDRGWVGIEALSGIPGTAGGTPIQNVGAYGQEISQTLARVRTWDRLLKRRPHLRRGRLQLRLPHQPVQAGSRPPRRAQRDLPAHARRPRRAGAVRRAGRAPWASRSVSVPPPARCAQAVLDLRRSKGMVLDPEDHDTWSTGSFFTNPIVPADVVPEGAPTWPQADGLVKTSAAWLIERAGFAKGYGNDRVRLSSRHTLALTNRGGATTADLLALAREIRDGVEQRFGDRARQRARAGRLHALAVRRCSRWSCR